jgi:thymidylate synthase ThyX
MEYAKARVNVLDHGYVQAVDSWGSEEGIIEAARMSTSKGFEGWGVEEVCSTCDGAGTENALADGVPKELARVALPVGRYSRMRASSNLRGWLNFLALRAEPHAQWEIQQYAWPVHSILAKEFPRTLALFDEGRSK